jgi:predicted O-methyltransferase YrrM
LNTYIEKIFRLKEIHIEGKKYGLNSNIDIEEGKFIQSCIKKIKAQRTIEIGCAQGISSLFICDAIKDYSNSEHIIIDPNQSTEWNSIGIKNLQKCNFTNFRPIEKPSEVVLPQLLSSGNKYDFAFIDGWHTFDHTLLDFFYLNRMLKIGGIIVIDDVGMPSVKKALRYILNYPCYEFFGNAGPIFQNRARKIANNLTKFSIPFTKFLGQKMRSEIFRDSFLLPDEKLKINSSMVAIRKISDDERGWNWYKEF